MAIKNIIDDALKTQLTRKEFLGQVGGLLLAVIGVTSIMHALGNATGSQHGAGSASSHGSGSSDVAGDYGASAYGG